MKVIDAGFAVENIWVSSGHDFRGRHGLGRLDHGFVEVDEVECVAGKGLIGDRYFDYAEDYKGQISFFSAEVLGELKEKYGEIDGSVLRRNVLVGGGDLQALLGRQFTLQGVVFESSEECKACYWMDQAVGTGAEDFLKGQCRGGLRARIVSTGKIRKSRSR